MRTSSAILMMLLIAGSASAVWAGQLDQEVDGYLAELDAAGLRQVRTRTPLFAAEPATDRPDERWHGAIDVWVWVPMWGSGSISVGGDFSFTSSTQTDLAGSGGGLELAEVDDFSGVIIPIKSLWWRDRWGILFDFTYADLNPKGTLLGRLGIPFDLDLQFWFVDAAATYMGLKPEVGKQPWFIWFYLGVRYINLEQRLTVGILPTVEASESFVGPLLGASIGYEFSESFSLLLRQDVSGFGISHGTGFTFTFQISGVWRFGKRHHGLLHFGWRLMALDLASGGGNPSLDLDLILHGPYLGIGYNF